MSSTAVVSGNGGIIEYYTTTPGTTISISSSNTYSGGTVVGSNGFAGGIFFNSSAAFGTGPVLVNTSASIYANGSVTITNPITLNGGALWLQGNLANTANYLSPVTLMLV